MNNEEPRKRTSPQVESLRKGDIRNLLFGIGIVTALLLGVSFGFLMYYVSDETENDEYYDSGYNDGYTLGYDDGVLAAGETGYEQGYLDGYNDGNITGYNMGYIAGYMNATNLPENATYNEGYIDGYSDGYLQGFIDGYTDHSTDDYIDGYADGYLDGILEGYLIGYNDGYADGLAQIFQFGKGQGFVTLPNSYNTMASTLPNATFHNGSSYDITRRDDNRYVNMTIHHQQMIEFGWQLAYITNDSLNDIQNITFTMILDVNQTMNITLWTQLQNGNGTQTFTQIEVLTGGHHIDYTLVGEGGFYSSMEHAIASDLFCNENTMFLMRITFPSENEGIDYNILLDQLVCTFYADNLNAELYTQFFFDGIDGFQPYIVGLAMALCMIGVIYLRKRSI